MKKLRKPFPVLQQYTYLNTAASGLLSEKVMEFRQDHDLDFLISGSILKDKQGELLTGVRETVGEFFKCAPNRVALTPNFSYGFNTFLEGLDKSKKVLLLSGDYPSITWAVSSREFEICYAEIDENLEQHIEAAMEKEHPDVFAFSIVQYISGIKLSIDFLKNLKQKFPETLFVADGTQYCGTEIFDFDDSGLDVLICSTYKWLNAGYGNAFILFNESVQGKIAPKAVGFNSLQGKYKAHEGNFIGKFEPGHLDTLSFGSLKTALGLLKDVGMELVQERIATLSKRAKQEFLAMELLGDMVVKRDQHSSIFNIKGDTQLYNFLKSENIICSQRGDGIRIAFHYFNTEEELDYLLKTLREYEKT